MVTVKVVAGGRARLLEKSWSICDTIHNSCADPLRRQTGINQGVCTTLNKVFVWPLFLKLSAHAAIQTTVG